MVDWEAPAGKKLYYEVFAVRHTESGYRTLAHSAVRSIVVPAADPTPAPEPYALWIEVTTGPDGITLHWEKCGTDGFVGYKIVRSQTNENPLYPLNAGTEIVAFVENAGATTYTDTNVSAGEKWYYRVLSLGYLNGQKVILGQTAAVAAVAE